MNDYIVVDTINKNVRIIQSKHDNTRYALKSVANNFPEEGIPEEIICELAVLGSSRHVNVMNMIDAFHDTVNQTDNIVLPLAVEDLESFIKRESDIQANDKPFAGITMFHQALCGLDYLHVNVSLETSTCPGFKTGTC